MLLFTLQGSVSYGRPLLRRALCHLHCTHSNWQSPPLKLWRPAGGLSLHGSTEPVVIFIDKLDSLKTVLSGFILCNKCTEWHVQGKGDAFLGEDDRMRQEQPLTVVVIAFQHTWLVYINKTIHKTIIHSHKLSGVHATEDRHSLLFNRWCSTADLPSKGL